MPSVYLLLATVLIAAMAVTANAYVQKFVLALSAI